MICNLAIWYYSIHRHLDLKLWKIFMSELCNGYTRCFPNILLYILSPLLFTLMGYIRSYSISAFSMALNNCDIAPFESSTILFYINEVERGLIHIEFHHYNFCLSMLDVSYKSTAMRFSTSHLISFYYFDYI